MVTNFFGEEIEKEVYISKEQLCDKSAAELYGRFFEDTYIFNI